MDYPSWFFGIQIEQNFGLKSRIKLSELSSCFLGQFIRWIAIGPALPINAK